MTSTTARRAFGVALLLAVAVLVALLVARAGRERSRMTDVDRAFDTRENFVAAEPDALAVEGGGIGDPRQPGQSPTDVAREVVVELPADPVDLGLEDSGGTLHVWQASPFRGAPESIQGVRGRGEIVFHLPDTGHDIWIRGLSLGRNVLIVDAPLVPSHERVARRRGVLTTGPHVLLMSSPTTILETTAARVFESSSAATGRRTLPPQETRRLEALPPARPVAPGIFACPGGLDAAVVWSPGRMVGFVRPLDDGLLNPVLLDEPSASWRIDLIGAEEMTVGDRVAFRVRDVRTREVRDFQISAADGHVQITNIHPGSQAIAPLLVAERFSDGWSALAPVHAQLSALDDEGPTTSSIDVRDSVPSEGATVRFEIDLADDGAAPGVVGGSGALPPARLHMLMMRDERDPLHEAAAGARFRAVVLERSGGGAYTAELDGVPGGRYVFSLPDLAVWGEFEVEQDAFVVVARRVAQVAHLDVLVVDAISGAPLAATVAARFAFEGHDLPSAPGLGSVRDCTAGACSIRGFDSALELYASAPGYVARLVPCRGMVGASTIVVELPPRPELVLHVRTPDATRATDLLEGASILGRFVEGEWVGELNRGAIDRVEMTEGGTYVSVSFDFEGTVDVEIDVPRLDTVLVLEGLVLDGRHVIERQVSLP